MPGVRGRGDYPAHPPGPVEGIRLRSMEIECGLREVCFTCGFDPELRINFGQTPYKMKTMLDGNHCKMGPDCLYWDAPSDELEATETPVSFVLPPLNLN